MKYQNDKLAVLNDWGQRVKRHWLILVNVILMSFMLALLLHDVSHSRDRDADTASINGLKQRMEKMEERSRQKRSFERSQQMGSPGAGSAIYTRWGRSVCPEQAELVYSGFAAGSLYTHVGGGADTLCLTDAPEWGEHNDAAGNLGLLYGAEYETPTNFPFSAENTENGKLMDENVPCAVCQSRRSSHLMIPGKQSCYDGWHMEYQGYLVGSHHTHKRAAWACMDAAPEGIPGGVGSQNGLLFYSVEGVCGSLQCPPYVNYREITCVVCTK